MGTGRKRIRVVYLDHTAALSGGELALVRLIEAAAPFVDAHVILGEAGPLTSRLQAVGATVTVLSLPERTRRLEKGRTTVGLPWRAVTDTLGYAWRLARVLRRIDPDIVHSNSLKSGVYGAIAARLAGVPLVWHLRDRLSDDYVPRSAQRLVRVLTRSLASVTICNSEATRRTLGSRGTSVVVPSIARPQSRSGAQTRRPDSDPLRVGLIGRIAPWKGQDLFLEAFAEAFAGDNAEATIVGAPMFGADERAFADSLPVLANHLGITDRVDFRGYRDSVSDELARLDILVHASTLPEPFGQVIVEGMAAGVTVIAADAGGPAETITHGVDGWLYPCGDREALVAAMRHLADAPHLRHSIAAQGQRTALSYGPTQIVTRLLGVYDIVGATANIRPATTLVG